MLILYLPTVWPVVVSTFYSSSLGENSIYRISRPHPPDRTLLTAPSCPHPPDRTLSTASLDMGCVVLRQFEIPFETRSRISFPFGPGECCSVLVKETMIYRKKTSRKEMEHSGISQPNFFKLNCSGYWKYLGVGS